jgi:hypothetical protein
MVGEATRSHIDPDNEPGAVIIARGFKPNEDWCLKGAKPIA